MGGMNKNKGIPAEAGMTASMIRLNKFISDSGLCSRREADRYIESGQVFVNGKRAEIGMSVSNKDKVLVNGLLIEPKHEEEFVLIALNKPRGIVSTTEKSEKDNIVDFVGFHERIFPIGRLDKDSQGLILLTNNGDIVNKILRAGNNHEKEYIVTVDKPVTEEFVKRMSSGIPILGTRTKKCKVERISEFVFKIILVQGLNRQIRRMCEYLGYEVVKLERIRIMNITLKGIGIGDWRFIEEKELKVIKAAIADSSDTSDASQKTKSTKSRTNYSKLTNSNSSSKKETSNFNPKSKQLRSKGKSRNERTNKPKR